MCAPISLISNGRLFNCGAAPSFQEAACFRALLAIREMTNIICAVMWTSSGDQLYQSIAFDYLQELQLPSLKYSQRMLRNWKQGLFFRKRRKL